MMIRLLFALMVFIIGVMGLQACHADNPPLTPPQTVTLHFGHQGVRDFYAYTHGKSEDYPKIMSFSGLYWHPPSLGTVNLKHFDSTTTIPHVFSATGVKKDNRTDGIGAILMSAGLSQAEFVTQEQAYQDYVALITAFKKAGWQHYFEPQHARIAKEDNVKILTYDNPDDVPDDRYVLYTGFSSDSLTPLTFEEWRQVIEEQQPYRLDLNLNLYLRDVTLWLKIEKTNNTKPNPIPNQPELEQYMVRLTFYTTKYEFYRDIRGDTIEELKQDYDENQERDKSTRQDYETRAKNAGFRINEDYQDPDMWQYIIEPAY